MRRLCWAVGLAWGCGTPDSVERADWPEVAAGVVCDRTAECARSAFEVNYFGAEDCRASVARDLAVLAEGLDDADCDYEPGAAGTGLEEIATMTCGDFYDGEAEDAIEDTWDCP